jgi:hypothetical protein
MRRLSALTFLIAAFVACGSNGSGAAPDGAAEGGGDDAPAQKASDAVAKKDGEDATVENPDDGGVSGDVQPGPTLVPDGGKAVPPDSDACSTSCAGDGGDAASEGGACPASCSTPMDCNSCPQKAFGGWSCNQGICQFMG